MRTHPHQLRFPRSIREANYMRHTAGLPILWEEDTGYGPSFKTVMLIAAVVAIVSWLFVRM